MFDAKPRGVREIRRGPTSATTKAPVSMSSARRCSASQSVLSSPATRYRPPMHRLRGRCHGRRLDRDIGVIGKHVVHLLPRGPIDGSRRPDFTQGLFSSQTSHAPERARHHPPSAMEINEKV